MTSRTPIRGWRGSRTELAWDRTALSFAALGGAILKSRPYAGIPILVVSALIWELGRWPARPARDVPGRGICW